MTQPKHTPGPWVRSMGGKCDVRAIDPERGQMIANTFFVRPECADRDRKTAECRANADLIAAAPELLEALREACTSLVIASDQVRDAAKTDSRWSGVDEKLLRYAREGQAVISKAEGRS